MSSCPICGADVAYWERYPRLLCSDCVARAQDRDGRPLRFFVETALGAGFYAEALDGSEWRRVEGGECWVDGRRCIVGEHRFGGVVVQLA
jgi:hypothetical protein